MAISQPPDRERRYLASSPCLTGRRTLDHNTGVHMTLPAFSVIVPQCSLAIHGGLYMEAIA
jgi:hypothetical protein